MKLNTVSSGNNEPTFRRKYCRTVLEKAVNYTERQLSARLNCVLSFNTGNFYPRIFTDTSCVAGICESCNLRDPQAAGTAEVTGGASEATAGLHSAAASQDTGAAGWFGKLRGVIRLPWLCVHHHTAKCDCSVTGLRLQ